MGNVPPPVLRPLGIADILDLSLRLYRHNFGAFLSITAVVYVPIAVLQVLGAFMAYQAMGMKGEFDQTQLATLIPAGALFLGAMALYAVAIPISQGALAIAVARRYLGQPASFKDAYASIGDRWGALVAAAVLLGLVMVAIMAVTAGGGAGLGYGIASGTGASGDSRWIIVAVGAFLGLVVGMGFMAYLGILLAFITPVIVVEGQPLMLAVHRSMALVRGEWWRCFGVFILLGLLIQFAASMVIWPVTIVTTLLLMESNPMVAQALNQGLGLVVGVFAQPIQIIGLVLLYYDLRVRKEAFDLELLAQHLGTTAPPPPVAAPLVQGYGVPLPAPPAYGPPPPPPMVSPPLPPSAEAANQRLWPAGPSEPAVPEDDGR